MTACRHCDTPLQRELIDLGRQPLSNAYLDPEPDVIASERSYPLRVMICEQCWLVQVEESLPADAIFNDNYAYFSSFSSSWVAHARCYAEAVIERFKLGTSSKVIEVASNDGYLLQHFSAVGIPCLGVEPAGNCADAAREKGIETVVAFFNRETARTLKSQGQDADLTVANNVLAHVPAIDDFVAGFAEILKPQGVSTFEFPHLLQMVTHAQFDTIYHEHYSYLSLLTVEQIFAKHGLRIFDVEELQTHGGSLRVFACHADARYVESPAVAAVRKAEVAAKLDRPEGYEGFSSRSEAQREELRRFFSCARKEGLTVAGYGAAAKGNTFLNFCGATPQDIAFVVDRNPQKQGRLLPGSHIPVRSPDALAKAKPDVVLILPWNLSTEIAREQAHIRQWGGRFAVAAPEFRIF